MNRKHFLSTILGGLTALAVKKAVAKDRISSSLPQPGNIGLSIPKLTVAQRDSLKKSTKGTIWAAPDGLMVYDGNKWNRIANL